MCCPFHGDKHPSMKVDSRFHCFACQADGDVIDFVGRLFQLSPYKAVEKLKEDFGMALADGKVRLAPRRPPTEIYTLSLHDALPILPSASAMPKSSFNFSTAL